MEILKSQLPLVGFRMCVNRDTLRPVSISRSSDGGRGGPTLPAEVMKLLRMGLGEVDR